MSIKQKRTLTEKNIAAHRENAMKSRGPVSPEGRQMQRDASLRHGFYSKDRDQALRALGEDPADFDIMVKAVKQKYPPADGFEEALGMRLARAMWRMDRADRMLEGYALRQAQETNRWRESPIHAQMMRLKMTGASLQSLAQSVAREHYVTSPADLAMMKNLFSEESLTEMGDIILALFMQLQEPGEHDEQGRRVDPHEQSRKAAQRIKEIFGLAGDTPPVVRRPVIPGQEPSCQQEQNSGSEVAPRPAEIKKADPPPGPQGPQLSPEEWAKREPVRQLLENLLARQADLCEAERTALLRQCVSGPSSFERAAEIAPAHSNALLMQRMQDSSFREVWRIFNLLLKLQRQAPGRDSVAGRPGSGNGREYSAPPFSPNFDPGERSVRAVVKPTLKQPGADAEATLRSPQANVGPTLRSERADLMVSPGASATTPPSTAAATVSPESVGKTSPTKDIQEARDVTRSTGHPSYSQRRTTWRHRADLTSCRRSQKKDVKMTVYPDKSNRIRTAPNSGAPADLRGAPLHGQDLSRCSRSGWPWHTPCHGHPARARVWLARPSQMPPCGRPARAPAWPRWPWHGPWHRHSCLCLSSCTARSGCVTNCGPKL